MHTRSFIPSIIVLFITLFIFVEYTAGKVPVEVVLPQTTVDTVNINFKLNENKTDGVERNPVEISEAYIELIDFYANAGDYERAVYYQDKLIQNSDSLNNIEKAGRLSEIQSEFDALRQEKEIEIANSRNRSQELKMEQQNLQRLIYYSGGLTAFLVMLGLLSRLYYMRKKRAELFEKNKHIAKEKKRAEENEKVKEQFLSKMSQEIRTPLSVIMGMTNALKRKKHYEQQSKYLEAIWKSSENLLVILNDIIDLSKLESGKIRIEKVLFKPRDELMKLRDLLKYKAEEKGVELSCKLDDYLPETLLGDPVRLNQILINLTGNAIKFTDAGKVSVSIGLKEKYENRVLLEARIADTGIGIPARQIDDIFTSFTQAEDHISKNYGGTGLGLTISKELVQLQGGTISVKSEVGRGSEFTFTIPYELSRSTLNRTAVERSSQNLLQGLKVLLVEDNEFNIMVAKDELVEIIDDVTIDLAFNGKQAIEMAAKNKYNLILMDIEMEKMNGYEATVAIRNLKAPYSRVPIIAITAAALKADIQKCFDVGMNGHLAKPFTPDQLKNKIESLYLKQT